MVAAAPKMAEDVGVVATGVFQGIGEDGHPLVVEQARREVAVVVNGLGKVFDGGSSPGGVEGSGAEYSGPRKLDHPLSY
jgi:hypothetical protein